MTSLRIRLYVSLFVLAVFAFLLYHYGRQRVYRSYEQEVPVKWLAVRGISQKNSKGIERAEQEILQMQDRTGRIDALLELYCSNNMVDKAIRMLENEARSNPGDWHSLVKAAECYTLKKEFDRAADCLREAEGIVPGGGDTFLYRTYGILYIRQKDYKKAVEYLDKSMALARDDANRAYAYGAYADLYIETKEYAKARDNAEKASRLFPYEQYFKNRIDQIDLLDSAGKH